MRAAHCVQSGEAHGHDGHGIALVVDAEVTSYLMMGALSPSLKRHSVTLFEGVVQLPGAHVLARACMCCSMVLAACKMILSGVDPDQGQMLQSASPVPHALWSLGSNLVCKL